MTFNNQKKLTETSKKKDEEILQLSESLKKSQESIESLSKVAKENETIQENIKSLEEVILVRISLPLVNHLATKNSIGCCEYFSERI